jgi:hypothetical protein
MEIKRSGSQPSSKGPANLARQLGSLLGLREPNSPIRRCPRDAKTKKNKAAP